MAGSISNAITLNRYAYANGNPVSNVDPFGLSAERGARESVQSWGEAFYNALKSLFGLKTQQGGGPTPLEAAYMAQHLYAVHAGKKLPDLKGKWVYEPDLLMTGTFIDGLYMGVYSRTGENGMEYCVVNRGTVSWSPLDSDLYNNLLQPIGRSPDMWFSIRSAKKFVKDHPDAHITFVGHSKGGAEAAANAVATNKNAILFNPATVNLNAYGLSSRNYNADMTAYIVKGEILNNIFGAISTPIDEMEYLPTQKGDAVDNHMMDAVIAALKEKGYQ